MKQLMMALAVLMAFTFSVAPTDVYAKKFGSSKSFGRSFQTAPSHQSLKTQPGQNQNLFGNQSAASQQKKKGLFGGLAGGLLGGLLAGTLIGSLLGGAFSGFGFMDVLIFAVLAFVLFKLFRSMGRRNQTASTSQWQSQPGGFQPHQVQPEGFPSAASSPSPQKSNDAKFEAGYGDGFKDSGFGQRTQGFDQHSRATAADNIPYNLPPDFDLNGFVRRACDHYRALQNAWNSGDMHTIRDYVSPDLYQHLAKERAALAGDQHTEVIHVDAQIVRADYILGKAEVSLRFSGRYRDNVERVEEAITDIWHLEQNRTDAPWLIVGIEEGSD